MYDHNLDGTMEAIEHQIEDLILNKILKDNVYMVLLVFARIMNQQDDQTIRRKIQSLQNVTPRHFGVSHYLLLNDETPIQQLA